MALQRSLGGGIFGGEGFVLQRLAGTCSAWVELGGEIVSHDLGPGETLLVHPGHVGMFEESVSFDITTIRGITNAIFGGDGLFLVQLTGPGRDLAADADHAEPGACADAVSWAGARPAPRRRWRPGPRGQCCGISSAGSGSSRRLVSGEGAGLPALPPPPTPSRKGRGRRRHQQPPTRASSKGSCPHHQ